MLLTPEMREKLAHGRAGQAATEAVHETGRRNSCRATGRVSAIDLKLQGQTEGSPAGPESLALSDACSPSLTHRLRDHAVAGFPTTPSEKAPHVRVGEASEQQGHVITPAWPLLV